MLFVDRFSTFTEAEVKALQKSGVDGSIAYLGAYTHPGWGKGITKETLQMYTALGWKTCFNYEGDPVSRSYFKNGQGQSDAHDVLVEFVHLGVKPTPEIDCYFSVDYNAHLPADFQVVDNYFVEVEKELDHKFTDGVYGGDPILTFLSSKDARSRVSKRWQTIAWSGGKEFGNINLYQIRVDVHRAGNVVDLDVVKRTPGYYPVPKSVNKAVPAKHEPAVHYHIVIPKDFTDIKQVTAVADQIRRLGIPASIQK